MTAAKKNIPALRFSSFKKEWTKEKVKDFLERIIDPVKVLPNKYYIQIGIRSHGKGIFHKEKVDGKSLGNKRVFWVKENSFVANIVFAWEQAVAVTSSAEKGMIASHRFPMYQPIDNKSDVNYLLHFFLTKKGKFLLELASPGGAGRNKTLGQKEFENLSFAIPGVKEQQKIASFLSSVDECLQQLQQQQSLLEQYKKGCMQQLFNQRLRFKDAHGKPFPKWEEKYLEEILIEHKTRNSKSSYQEVFSVAKTQGVVNQIEHLGRSYSSADTSNYKVVFPGDIVYTKSPTGEFPFGIIKQNRLSRTGIVSVLYAVFSPTNKAIGSLLDHYFSDPVKIYNYLNPLVKRGAKNTMNISNSDFLKGSKLLMPLSEEEQTKIANFLSTIDEQINTVKQQIAQTQQFKKGLLQQMFV